MFQKFQKGGGVGLYIRNSMQHKYIPLLSKCIANCAEIVTAEVTLRNGKILIIIYLCCIYRAPNTDLALLNEHINIICSKTNSKNIYVVTLMLIYYNMTNMWKPIIVLINYTATGYNHL